MRTGERQRAAPVAAADPAEFQRQHRADPLAAGKQTVAHGVKQPLLRRDPRKKLPLQKRFDGLHDSLRNLRPEIHSSRTYSVSAGVPSAVFISFTTSSLRARPAALSQVSDQRRPLLKELQRILPAGRCPARAAGRSSSSRVHRRLQRSVDFALMSHSSWICFTRAVRLPLLKSDADRLDLADVRRAAASRAPVLRSSPRCSRAQGPCSGLIASSFSRQMDEALLAALPAFRCAACSRGRQKIELWSSGDRLSFT